MINRLNIFLVALLVVIFDQLSKFIIDSRIILGQKISLIDSVISLTKAYNTGAAFSILEGNPLLLAIFSLFVSILISVYFIKKIFLLPRIIVLAWGLILGGTIGNLVDRLLFGYVIDFIRLDFINFPIFNLADSAINIGAFLIIIYTLTKSESQINTK